jgi:prepilin-type N-terminal cleavage/methylation domain-containing protein
MMFSKRFKSKRGMTMIELLATVAVIGIIAAMAVPRFQKAYERINFRAANRDITSKIRLARSYAVSTKEQHGLYVDPNDLSYTLFKDVVNTPAMQYDVGDSVITVDTLPTGFTLIAIDVPSSSIVFRSNGSTAGTANIVTLAETEDLVGVHQHTILAATGRTETISDYY